jgi:serine protease Do
MNLPGFGEIAEQLRRSTVNINRGGSGVIWNADGLVVTNAHVVNAIRGRLQVELWDGRMFDARCLTKDPRRDLAVLETGASGLPAIAPGDSNAVRPGQLAIAVGNPLGFVGALSTGVIHAVGPLNGLGRQQWVQADVRLAPGNSGGPLADARGRLVGVNTMVAGGLALAIPSNTVVAFLKNGPSSKSIGVTVRPVPRAGLVVLAVEAGSPADRASLLVGDVLIGANGKRFTTAEDLRDSIDDASDRLSVEFLRGDRQHSREVTLQLTPQREAA